MTNSEKLMERAVTCIPGGVNSPVRSYGKVGMTPRFIKGADGAYIFDEDDNTYIDYICSWGPMILGHNNETVRKAVEEACKNGLSFGAATKAEVEIAEFICEKIPHVEMIRMVNSGTEAVMSAIRVARGYTGRNKIIKFEGNYHGHSDGLLVAAGSGLMTAGIPGSAGVPEGCTKDTLTAEYNNLDSVQALFDANRHEIAAIVVEPVAANMGVVLPKEGFLEGLRKLCDEEGALLIFDEVITGFRLAFGGAAQRFGITPDLVTYGKIIGGGMSVGAYGGRRDIMKLISPVGAVYQAGTLSGNPVAMAAGSTQLKLLWENRELYRKLDESGEKLYGRMKRYIQEKKLPLTVNYIGSLGCLFFKEGAVTNYQDASESRVDEFNRYFAYMLNHGIHLAPSQFEAMFLSVAHTDKELDETFQVFRDFFEGE